jgi:hypothetical protein
MTATHLHLTVVHLPVVGCVFVAVLLAVALWRRSDLLFVTACCLLLACAGGAVAAYYSGPPAYEQVKQRLVDGEEAVEQHALLGRASFVGMILLGVLAIQALLRTAAGEGAAGWLRRVLLAGTLLLCWLLAWTAHLGGAVRHDELRGRSLPVFPSLTPHSANESTIHRSPVFSAFSNTTRLPAGDHAG